MIKKLSEIGKLKKENKELKEMLAIALNKSLLRELTRAIQRIERGEYYSEIEFAKKHHLVTA